jgi:DNA-binding Lrp family transcriptional regulator
MKEKKVQDDARILLKSLNNKTKFNMQRYIKTIGITRQSFQNKFNKLKEKKIIKNFTININPNLNPTNLKFVILEIKTNPTEPFFIDELLKIRQLKILDGILGEFSLFVLFIFESSTEYYEVLNDIDNLMAKSYFKKYQIIETIKVFKTNGVELASIKGNSDYKIDEVDRLILKILRDDQGLKPISTYEIKAILNGRFNSILEHYYKKGISQPTIYNRIKKLEEEGLILNYSVNFHPKKIGYEGKYLVRIKPKDPSKYNEIALKLEKIQSITDLFRIGEQYGLFAIVRVEKIEDFATFIRELYRSEEIEDTYTSFVLDELIPYTNFLIS